MVKQLVKQAHTSNDNSINNGPYKITQHMITQYYAKSQTILKETKRRVSKGSEKW